MDNQTTYGKSRLQEAIRRYEITRYDAMPEAEEPICYSDRYLKKINRLCKKSDPFFSYPKLGFRKAVAVALCTAMLLITAVFSVTATRTAVTEWFINVYESFTEIFSIRQNKDIAPDSIETAYSPTALPEGYTLHEEYLAQSEHKLTWKNKQEEYVYFIQTPLHAKSTFDNENTENETAFLSDVKCYIVRKNGKTCLYWNTKEYSFTLIVPETVSREQYSDIIASVQETKQNFKKEE